MNLTVFELINLQYYDIILTKLDLDETCDDYLMVEDPTSAIYWSFCGDRTETICIHAYSPSVLITFISDSNANTTGTGFEIYYETSGEYNSESYSCGYSYTLGKMLVVDTSII